MNAKGDTRTTHPPRDHVLDLARRIRLALGNGGALFPGSAELYDAAEKIEAWAREWGR